MATLREDIATIRQIVEENEVLRDEDAGAALAVCRAAELIADLQAVTDRGYDATITLPAQPQPHAIKVTIPGGERK